MENSLKNLYTAPPGGRFGYFLAADGTNIRFATWRNGTEDRGTIVLLHGRREYIEKYFETIGELLKRGFSVLTMDWRGQGLSDRPLPNRQKHHLQSYDPMVADIDILLAQEGADMPGPFTLLAHSMGAHVAIRYLHDRNGNHPFVKAILLAPMIGIPFILLPGLIKMIVRSGGGAYYAVGQSDFDPAGNNAALRALLTSDKGRFAAEMAYLQTHPDRMLGGVTWGWLDASLASVKRITAPGYAEAITTPTLIIQCERDRVVDNRAMADFAKSLPNGTLVKIRDARHEVYRERDEIRAEFWQAVDCFLDIRAYPVLFESI